MLTSNNKEIKDAFDEIMRLEEQKANVAESIKAIYAKLKSNGHEVDALKKIVADQKKEIKKVLQTEEMVDIYRNALGILAQDKEDK